MFVRNLRWMTACVAALVAIGFSPARSKADVQILVEEFAPDGSGGFTLVSGTTLTPLAPGAALFNGSHFFGTVTVGSNSGSPNDVASLVPTFTGRLTSTATGPESNTLKITVTDSNFQSVGTDGTLKVQVAGTTGFASGSESISETTRVFDPATNQTIATFPNPLVSPDGTQQTDFLSATGLTNPFAIQQILTVSFNGSIPGGAAFQAGGGASLTTNAVPAPGGLALALIGLPLIGLRRALRKPAA